MSKTSLSTLKIIGEILEVLKGCNTFLISSHINPDGDAIGSQLAFYSLLSHLRKSETAIASRDSFRVSVVNSDPVPFSYSFLPNSSVINVEPALNTGVPLVERLVSDSFSQWEAIATAEVAVILDCGNLNRVGERLAEAIAGHPKRALINIDHHISNDHFGTYNLVDVDACATAELIFNIIEYEGIEIGLDRAICLYTAILTDTGSFKYANTTSSAFRVAARLIDEGVCPDRVAELVYEVIPYQKAKLFGMALETLQLSSDGKIAWMSVTREMHRRTETGSADTEGLIEYIRSLRGVEVALLFREIENGAIKVSLRSKSEFDVNRIAAMFGGGGHKAAAGCVISKPLDKVTDMVLKALESVL